MPHHCPIELGGGARMTYPNFWYAYEPIFQHKLVAHLRERSQVYQAIQYLLMPFPPNPIYVVSPAAWSGDDVGV